MDFVASEFATWNKVISDSICNVQPYSKNKNTYKDFENFKQISRETVDVVVFWWANIIWIPFLCSHKIYN